MALLLVALQIDTLLVGLAIIVLRKYVLPRFSHFRVGGELTFASGAAVAFIVLFFMITSGLWAGMIARGTDVTPTEYRGWGPAPPAAAQNVSFFRNYNHSEATFAIDEASLAQWAQGNGWQVAEIVRAEHIYFTNLDIEREVTSGVLTGKQPFDRGGAHVIYDRTSETAYYRYSAR